MRTPSEEQDRPALNRRDIVALILATYRSSFPYLLVFIAGLLLATWFFTEIVF